jgi:hypothetical protein
MYRKDVNASGSAGSIPGPHRTTYWASAVEKASRWAAPVVEFTKESVKFGLRNYE